MKQTVVINAMPITNNYFNRGVGNLTCSLIRELIKDESINWVLVGHGNKNDFQKRLWGESLNSIGSNPNYVFESLGNSSTLLEKVFAPIYQLKINKIVNKYSPALYLSFQQEFCNVPNIPSITYIHDFTPYLTGVFSQKNWLINQIKKLNYNWHYQQLKSNLRYITNSEYTKSTILSAGFPDNKVEVIYPAVNTEYKNMLEEHDLKEITESVNLKRRTLNIYNITEPYFIYLGGLEENKNVPAILEAFSLIREKYPQLKMVIGGGEFKLGWDHKPQPLNERATNIMKKIDELKLSHQVLFSGFIETKHLPLIYANAEFYIHLSKHEGFGLNVIEPQLVSTPVIASNLSSYPEVLGGSAILVDPSKTIEVSDAMQRLLAQDDTAEKLRSELTKKGKENIQRFSWKKSTEKLMKIINSEINKPQTKLDKNTDIKNSPKLKSPTPISTETEPKKKRAVVICQYFHPFSGGMEKVALDYALFLKEEGYEVTVLTSDRKSGLVVKKKSEKYLGLKIERLKKSGKNYYLNNLEGLFNKLTEIEPEIIHKHSFGMIFQDMQILRYKNYIKRKNKQDNTLFLNTPHGPFMAKAETGLRSMFKFMGNFIQSLYLNKLFDMVFAVNMEQERWINNIYKIDKNKIKFAPPVLPQPPKTEDLQQKILSHKIKKKYIQISAITRLSRYKGLQDLLAAFGEINSATNTKLVIAGAKEDYHEQLEKLVRNHPRREDITLEIDVSDNRRDEILKDTDIFVLASEWEAFGIVLGEAMAYGTALISTTTEGGRFLVKPGKNGYLFDYRDLKVLINHLNTLLTNNDKMREMQKESFKVVTEFSREKLKGNYISTLKNEK